MPGLLTLLPAFLLLFLVGRRRFILPCRFLPRLLWLLQFFIFCLLLRALGLLFPIVPCFLLMRLLWGLLLILLLILLGILFLLTLLLLLLLLLLLFEGLFQQLFVEFGVGVLRLLSKRVLICRNGLGVTPQTRQRVAPVVAALRVVTRRQTVNRALIIPGAVLRGGFPGRIIAQFHRARIILSSHRPLSLLVFAQPQLLPVQGVRRIGHGQQQEQAQHVAAPEQQGSQGQQTQYQPGALFAPHIRGDFSAGLLTLWLRVGKKPVQAPDIRIVLADTNVHAATGAGQFAQIILSQNRDHDGTVLALQEATVRQQHRGAMPGAHAQHRQSVALAA